MLQSHSNEFTEPKTRAEVQQPIPTDVIRRGTARPRVITFSLLDGLGTCGVLPVVPGRRGPDVMPAQLYKMPHRGCPEGSYRCTLPCCPTDLPTDRHAEKSIRVVNLLG